MTITEHSTQPSPSRFEDRLLAELRAVVISQEAPARAAVRPRRRLTLSLAGGAVATAATVAAVTLGGGGTPAFAVDRGSDGDVTVTITSLKDAAGLQKALIAAGVPADVTYTPAGKACAQPRFTPAASHGPGRSNVDSRRDGTTTFTITRGQVRPGETLVIETSVGSRSMALGVAVAQGPVSACRLVDSSSQPGQPGQPGQPAPQGGNRSGSSLTTHSG